MDKEKLLGELKSDDFTVRLAAISSFNDLEDEEIPEFMALVLDDENHEVREAAADFIARTPDLFPRYLNDPDPSVQIILIEKSPEIVEIKQNREEVVKLIGQLESTLPEVQCAIAHIIPKHFIPKDNEEAVKFLTTEILPILEKLYKSTDDDVRMAVADSARDVVVVYGYEVFLENFHKIFEKMMCDTQWRIRNRAVELALGITSFTNTKMFFSEVFPFIEAFLKDPSQKVRRYTISLLPGIASIVDKKEKKFIPKLFEAIGKMSQSKSFIERQTYLQVLSVTYEFFRTEAQMHYIYKPMIKLLMDDSDNVKLLAMDILEKQKHLIHPFSRQYELEPILETLVENGRPTVKAKAHEFLEECHNAL